MEVKGDPVSPAYLGEAKGSLLKEDGFYPTGDLCWIDDEGWLHIVGREKELTLWKDSTYIDPQYLSNLMVRSIYIKDAMVTQVNPEDEFLSVFVFPDEKRLKKDPKWQKQIDTGVSPDSALRQRIEDAIDYAQSVAKVTATLSKDHIYILPRKLERTPTHKIKFIFERQRLDQSRRI